MIDVYSTTGFGNIPANLRRTFSPQSNADLHRCNPEKFRFRKPP